MRVLLVNADKEENGFCSHVLQNLIPIFGKRTIETQIVWLGSDDLKPCIECQKCHKIKRCVFDGDAVNRIAEHAPSYDGIIVCGRAYYGQPSDQVVSFMNRLFTSNGDLFAKKAGGFVLVSRNHEQVDFSTLYPHYLKHNVIAVPSLDDAVISEQDDEEGLLSVQTMADNMSWLLSCIACARKNGIDDPEYKKRITGYAIR